MPFTTFLQDQAAASVAAWKQEPVKYSLVISLLLITLCSTAISVYRVWFHPLSAFPGPKYLAITGLPEQWKTNIHGTWFREVASHHRKYGPIVRTGPNHLSLDGNIGWQQIYAHKTGKPEFTKYPGFLFPLDHHSIIGSNTTDVHRRQRRTLAHAFSDTALKEQEGIIAKYIDLLIDKLDQQAATGNPVNIVNWLNFTTFDIIGDLTFADPFHSLDNNDYHPFVLNFFKGIRGDARNRLMKLYPILKPLIYAVWGTGDHIMSREQREMSMSKAQSRMALGIEPKPGRRDFSTYMLKTNRDGENGMTNIEILINSPILVGAGSETTATGLSGFFFYLGNHPNVYQRLAQEIREAFSDETEINMASTQKLQYLHAVIEEILRIYPPAVEVTPRISPGAEIDGKWVPKGTRCSVSPWVTFRNPDNFADPDSFVPERWLPQSHPQYNPKYASDNKAAFKPFSFGSRDCIGKNLAYSEMRIVMSRILYHFDFVLAPGQENWHNSQHTYLVWSKGPLNVYLKPRKAKS